MIWYQSHEVKVVEVIDNHIHNLVLNKMRYVFTWRHTYSTPRVDTEGALKNVQIWIFCIYLLLSSTKSPRRTLPITLNSEIVLVWNKFRNFHKAIFT